MTQELNLDEDERIAREALEQRKDWHEADACMTFYKKNMPPEKLLAYIAAVRERDARLKRQARTIRKKQNEIAVLKNKIDYLMKTHGDKTHVLVEGG